MYCVSQTKMGHTHTTLEYCFQFFIYLLIYLSISNSENNFMHVQDLLYYRLELHTIQTI